MTMENSSKNEPGRLRSKLRDRREYVFLGLVTALGAILRITLIVLDPTVSRDGIKYLSYAAGIADTVNEVTTFPPLFVWLIRFFHLFGFSWELSGWLISLISGILLIPIARSIADRVTGKSAVGWAAALLTAVHPGLIHLSAEIQRGALFIMLEWLGIHYLLCTISRERIADWIMLGILSALATLTRFEGLELVIMTAGVSIYLCFRRGWKYSGRGFASFAGALLACFLLAALPEGAGRLKEIYLRRWTFVVKHWK